MSLTSIVVKLAESIIRGEIITHMKLNNLFSKKQFEFLGGRSTVLQLLMVLDKWTEILDQGGVIDVIYCDFMKAFDKVPHNRLLEKIACYGICGKVHRWLQGFLLNRHQRVMVQGSFSKWHNVLSGIPQGSVLGPLMFVMYINDLPIKAVNSELFLFADQQRLAKLRLPTLAFRRLRGDMIETYKILTGKYDRDVTEGLFRLRGDSDTRGHSLKIFKERPRLDCRKYSFTYRVADPWNSLTENIIQAPTVSAFERRLDKHWKNQDLMYNFRAPPSLEHAQTTKLSTTLSFTNELAPEAQ